MITVNTNPLTVIEEWNLPTEQISHPKTVQEAAAVFDKQFKGWWKKIDLNTFEQGICAYNCLFGQVFGDRRFDLYRAIFKEEDEGLPANKNPKHPGLFWLKKHEAEWVTEIKKRKERK